MLSVWNANELELESTVPVYEHVRDLRVITSAQYTSITGRPLTMDAGGLSFVWGGGQRPVVTDVFCTDGKGVVAIGGENGVLSFWSLKTRQVCFVDGVSKRMVQKK